MLLDDNGVAEKQHAATRLDLPSGHSDAHPLPPCAGVPGGIALNLPPPPTPTRAGTSHEHRGQLQQRSTLPNAPGRHRLASECVGPDEIAFLWSLAAPWDVERTQVTQQSSGAAGRGRHLAVLRRARRAPSPTGPRTQTCRPPPSWLRVI